MTVKSKAKSKIKPAAKAAIKVAVKKSQAKTKIVLKKKIAKTAMKAKPAKVEPQKTAAVESAKPEVKPTVIKRTMNPVPVQQLERRKPAVKQPGQRNSQFNFMKAPGTEHAFEVGDIVEVFCDHEKNRDRIRGWVKGIVVQVDHKLAAVQFRSNVYLTDGWMVPDRILWFPLTSEHIRPVAGGKKSGEKKDFIPDY